jgi:hypothetical protein
MAQKPIELNELELAGSNDVAQQQSTAKDGPSLEPSSSDPSLPPVDGGKQAWLFLAACWVVEAFVFGESSSRTDISFLDSPRNSQDSAFHMASTRTSTTPMSRSQGQVISL